MESNWNCFLFHKEREREREREEEEEEEERVEELEREKLGLKLFRTLFFVFGTSDIKDERCDWHSGTVDVGFMRKLY
jgi:hypothetical protein